MIGAMSCKYSIALAVYTGWGLHQMMAAALQIDQTWCDRFVMLRVVVWLSLQPCLDSI